MRRSLLSICAAVMFSVMTTAGASANTIAFLTDPFAGSTALTTPGRQIVAGETFVPVFNTATDVFLFEAGVFGAYGVTSLSFLNNTIDNVPASGVNTIVLRTFDDDANTGTPFAAGNAANLIAGRITVPTPGFFIYFNQGLDLPRLVFSTDLNDNTSDLKVLARLLNFTGTAGQAQLATFTAANFALQAVPEPGTLLLMGTAGAWFIRRRSRRQ